MDGQEELSHGLLGHRQGQTGLLGRASSKLGAAVGAARRARRGTGRRGWILDFLALALAAIAMSVMARMVGMMSPLSAVTTTTTTTTSYLVRVNMGADGGASVAQPGTPGGSCNLDVQQSPLAKSCTQLTDVCVDQVG